MDTCSYQDAHQEPSHDDRWSFLTDPLLVMIFSHLQSRDLCVAIRTCKNWCRVGNDEKLWRKLVRSKVKSVLPDPCETWKQTYKRITYHVPSTLADTIEENDDEIYGVTFSPSGKYIATAASDGWVKVWNFSDMKHPSFQRQVSESHYTNWVEFNQSETLLLVHAVQRGPQFSHPAAILVLSLEEEMRMLSASGQYLIDIRGTWYDDRSYLIVYSPLYYSTEIEVRKKEVLFGPDNEKVDIITDLCHCDSDGTILFKIEEDFNEHHMIKVFDCNENFVESTFPVKSTVEHSEATREKIVILFCGGTEDLDSSGIFMYRVTEDMYRPANIQPVRKIPIRSDCIGLTLSADKRFLTLCTRDVEEETDDDDDDDEMDDDLFKYSLDVRLRVLDLLSNVEQFKDYHGNTSMLKTYCCFLISAANDRYVASGTEKGEVLVWDRRSCDLLEKLTHIPVPIPAKTCVNAVTFHPNDPEVMVSVADNKTIKIWKSRNRLKSESLQRIN